MVFISFNILALLLVSFALQSLYVHGVHQERRLVENNSVKENDVSSLNKELVDGTLGMSIGSRKARIGGRKTANKEEDGEMGSRSSTGDSKKLNVEASFVAFTADYHMAKHHPPRNN